MVFLRPLSWSKHEKVPVLFFSKQLKTSGSSCRHSINVLAQPRLAHRGVRACRGRGSRAGRAVCTHRARPLFCGYLGAADEQRKGARAELEARSRTGSQPKCDDGL